MYARTGALVARVTGHEIFRFADAVGTSDILQEAERLSIADAERILSPWMALGRRIKSRYPRVEPLPPP
jgi:hypothetical protein